MIKNADESIVMAFMKRKKIPSTSETANQIVTTQVPPGRRTEIRDYLRLFGYDPNRTILQVHIPGFFSKRHTTQTRSRQSATKRYGGTTFVVVGRTHDPSIIDQVIKPRRKQNDLSPSYIGYLWKNKDLRNRSPHEVVPLDFTPITVPYPKDWKNMFANRGFLVALHVPTSFAKDKNRLSRALYRSGKNVDVKRKWDFIGELWEFGYRFASRNSDAPLEE